MLANAEPLRNLLVGLSAPDYRVEDQRNSAVDWQRDSKYYQFWTRAGVDGTFAIPNIRPGNYTLTVGGASDAPAAVASIKLTSRVLPLRGR